MSRPGVGSGPGEQGCAKGPPSEHPQLSRRDPHAARRCFSAADDCKREFKGKDMSVDTSVNMDEFRHFDKWDPLLWSSQGPRAKGQGSGASMFLRIYFCMINTFLELIPTSL